MARRALEIGTVVAAATAEGVPLVFVTLTARHHRRQRLATVWDGTSKGWGRVTSGKQWQGHRAEFGIEGYVRVQETTHGETNGWHPHVHALFAGHGFGTNDAVDEFCGSAWNRWSLGLQRAGLDAPLPHASEWHTVSGDFEGTNLGQYLAKGYDAAGAIGMELTQTQSKVARSVHSTRSTWELLTDALNGEVVGLNRWWEWERASKGRRQIAWSRGFRERFGLGVEQTDDEIAGEELGTRDDAIVHITRRGWAALVQQPTLIPQVLDQAEQGGQSGLSAWLDDHEIEHRRVR